MLPRRDFFQLAAATAVLVPGGWTRAFAQQRLTQDDLLRFAPLGNVTLVHIADHSCPAGAAADARAGGQSRHRRGQGHGAACQRQGAARALQDRARLGRCLCAGGRRLRRAGRTYGRLGGLDRIATILKAIRAERGDRVLLLDGGDTWQNSYTSLVSKGQDVIDCMALLQAGRHGRALGVHARRRARQGDRRRARLPVPRPEPARHRMERVGVRADDHDRARRRARRR